MGVKLHEEAGVNSVGIDLRTGLQRSLGSYRDSTVRDKQKMSMLTIGMRSWLSKYLNGQHAVTAGRSHHDFPPCH